ncbi:MAG: AAA family ATPase, partial [Acidimicrobiia bacterium]
MGTITVLAAGGPVDGAVFGRIVAEHHGIVAASGEAMVARFGAATAAVDAAVALQRASGRPHTSTLAIGLATVDASGSDADGNGRSGPGEAIALAHALLERAEPGEILLTDITHRLARPGVQPSVVGTLERPRRWGAPPIARLAWHPRPSIADGPAPEPSSLRRVAAMPFVGGPSALATLQLAWRAAGDGARRLVIVAGEPGAGKTRLATEFARSVHDQGGVVLWGSSSATGEMPFQPFAEALRAVLAPIGPARRDELVGSLAPDLGLLLPRLFASQDDDATDGDAATRRYWMFEAVATVLERLAHHRPVLLVLDDLHWAGASTAQLAEHVLRADRSGGLCMVATTRNTAEDIGDPARAFLAAAARFDGTQRIDMEGLDEEEVEELVSALVGHTLDADLRRIATELRS